MFPSSPAPNPVTPPVAPPPASGIAGNPAPAGLVGLPSWFWLTPAPVTGSADQWIAGLHYRVQTAPQSATWNFGDGTHATLFGAAAFGQAYPSPSSVSHVYQAQSAANAVAAVVSYDVSWFVDIGGWRGPFALPAIQVSSSLAYPVQQAQPELG